MICPFVARVRIVSGLSSIDPDTRRDENGPALDEDVEMRVHVVLEELRVLRDEARRARELHRVVRRGPRRLGRARSAHVAELRANALVAAYPSLSHRRLCRNLRTQPPGERRSQPRGAPWSNPSRATLNP